MSNPRFQPKGWYSRGYLPHFDGGPITQFITIRLFDSLPQKVLDKWREETESFGKEGEIIFRKKIEMYLDLGRGSCYLRDNRVAEMMQNSLLYHDEKKYRLSAWVVMPNHVHFLATPIEGFELEEIMHSVKSYTAHEANKILKRTGDFWQHESFDRYIRNAKHYTNVVRYIENNPVKAGLCKKADDWIYSSAYFRSKK
jgi:REP element-mobilizing transposase RayT